MGSLIRLSYLKKLCQLARDPEMMLRGGSLKRPQRERLPSFEIGILVKNKIKTTIVARTNERFVFAKKKSIERVSIFHAFDSNRYTRNWPLGVSTAITSQEWLSSVLLGLTSPEMDPSSNFGHGGTRGAARMEESRTV
jgi:hypothetical protein